MSSGKFSPSVAGRPKEASKFGLSLTRFRVNLKKDIYNIPWSVYILECQDRTLYVGMTLDVFRRLKEHNSTNKCRYTRSRKPLKLVYQEKCLDHYDASCREIEIKSFSRKRKLALISQFKSQ